MSRLTAERLGELYVGTLQLVAEHGYDKLTMDQIAEATHSSKATLYRQWGSKAALVVDALRCTGELSDEAPDTGSLRGDLRAIAHSKGDGQIGESDLIVAIVQAMRQSDELAEAVRTQMIGPGRERIRLIIQRAIDRGEVAADCPAIDYIDLVFIAPIVLRPVLDDVDLDPAYLDRYFESVLLPALGVTTPLTTAP